MGLDKTNDDVPSVLGAAPSLVAQGKRLADARGRAEKDAEPSRWLDVSVTLFVALLE